MNPIKALYRILALVGKEIVEVFRRPGAVISLVLGPFLILAVFGLGYHGVRRELNAIVVAPPNVGLPTDPTGYEGFETRGVTVVEVVTDRGAAETKLRAEQVDLVIVAPDDLQSALEQGRQAQVTVEMNLTDPVQANYAAFLAEVLVGSINREIYRLGAEAGQGYAIRFGAKELSNIPPDVIASPTKATVINFAPIQPAIGAYFGPAALALVLQHMAVTLLALSIVRERMSGAMDLFRASPIRASELVVGKVLAFGFLGSIIATISLVLLVGMLHVPILAPIPAVAVVVFVLLLASLGLGLLISVVSDSERQAVQLSLLVLLASMFFSGFVLRVEEFDTPVQIGAYLLPVTHGIRLLQDLMLRGTITHPWQLLALIGIGGVLLVTSSVLLRREMRPA
jgi:ABC-2 type transport system permease protein